MTSEVIAQVIGVVTIISAVCRWLYKYFRRMIAMRRMIWRYLQDSFLNEYDGMEAYRAMIRKACMEDAKECFRK